MRTEGSHSEGDLVPFQIKAMGRLKSSSLSLGQRVLSPQCRTPFNSGLSHGKVNIWSCPVQVRKGN
jgi:hypothetical protein